MKTPRRIASLFERPRRLFAYARTAAMALGVTLRAPRAAGRTVIFFNATTRLSGLSLNAGFALLAAWALRLAGVPVTHFVCRAGMSRCVLGTDQDRPAQAPPCASCVRQSRISYLAAPVSGFSFRRDAQVEAELAGLDLPALMRYERPFAGDAVPLGALVLPSLRWRLRAHSLPDDEPTRFLYREFMLSAWNVLTHFAALLGRVDAQALVVYNGQFFPEAVAAWLARRRGLRVITHEVGLQPLSAFFTAGEATAYPIAIPESFRLSSEQNARLDAYLEKRLRGKFSMAGIQFWPEMKGLDEAFLKKLAGFRQLVPVFTNVIFDTSQPHANTLFPDMFAWLDLVLATARAHPETLFVVRAHPDESRPGKVARESVAGWVERTSAAGLPNLVFIPSDQYVSSYEMIGRAKFVMIYNSTIGLEAAILGAPVLSAGRARFTQYPIVFFPESRAEYERRLEEFLRGGKIEVPAQFKENARRFLYYQLFRTSLPFGDLLAAFPPTGYVELRPGALRRLWPERSPAVSAFLDGILRGGDFLLKE